MSEGAIHTEVVAAEVTLASLEATLQTVPEMEPLAADEPAWPTSDGSNGGAPQSESSPTSKKKKSKKKKR